MIETVLMFGFINIIFELVLLSMLTPRLRLRVLGNRTSQSLIHVSMLLANLMVHWGTVVGTMSSILAFVCSIAAIKGAQLLFGKIVDGRHYTRGLIGYSASELK